MGDYTIVIEGTGAHHNLPPNHTGDADHLVREFVEKLQSLGHTVHYAQMTSGRKDILYIEKPDEFGYTGAK